MFQLFLRMVRELFLPKVLDLFWLKAAELTADDAHSSMKNMKEFESTLKNLQANLKLLSAKASDIEEQIKNAELLGLKKRKREVEEWLEQVKSIEEVVVELETQVVESQGFIMRLMDGGKVAQLNKQVEKLVEQSRDFGELLLDVCGTSGETFLTDGMVGGAFSENMERIMKLLEAREVSRIGVYGMGGVGKTTLVKHIYNRLLREQEGHVFWVTVSQEFSIRSLQDKIAGLLGVNLSEEDEEDMRATRLHRALFQEKISVLILDDMWENIDMKKVGCTFSVECCRLIITTRSLEVCDQFLCQEVIHVVKLHEGEAWELFNETLGSRIELCPQVERIAKSVAKLCGGLPLAIITMAGSMRGKTSIHTWKNAFVELQERVTGQDSMGNSDEVFKVLKYSFDRLKKINDKSNGFNTIQLCFMYCSLYPEDYEINREDLIRKFISAGLLSQRKSRRARVHHGQSILDKLVSLCLLEISDEHVKMHDLMRGMALKIGEGKYLVRAGDHSLKEIYDLNDEEWTKDVETASLVRSYIRRIEDGTSPNCPKLSTLLLWENDALKVIPDSFFSKMQGLCTLDLCKTGIRMLPDSLSDLTSLKALLLEYCTKLEYVPYLGKLKALRELNLFYTAIQEVPQGVEELVKLEFLSLLHANNLTMLPSGLLRKLVHLRHLGISFHIKVPIADIQNLKLLEEFYGRVERVEDFNSFIRSGESHWERNSCYTIKVGEDRHVEAGLRSYKKKLGLFECSLEDERVLGQDTEYLTIRECKGLRNSFLDDFLVLKMLIIDRCGGIEWILRSDGQGSEITLEHINAFELDDLKGVVMDRGDIGPSASAPAQPAVFFSLRKLTIVKCNKMRKAGLLISGLPNLESVYIYMCGEIEKIFEDEGAAASTLPKLKYLVLGDLPRLKSVSKTTIISNSIQRIWIRNCPRLMNKLPLLFDDPTPPPTLREIKVEREWWESLEWDININPNLPRLLFPFVQFQD